VCQRQFVLARIPNFGHDADILNELENVEVEKIYSIYRITNTVNQKVYIGKTGDIRKRWRSHICASRRPNDIRRYSVIHRAMSKYGVDNFTFEVIYQSKDHDHILNEMEPLFITAYKMYGVGVYNLTDGGEGRLGHKPSEETKAKMRVHSIGNKFAIGYKHTDEARRKIGIASTGNTYASGTVYTEAMIRNKREAQLGKTLTDDHRKKIGKANSVSQCKCEYEVIHPCGKIEIINNIATFSRENNLHHAAMYAVIHGKYKQHKGFRCTKLS
jgi:group I intron endonuclease